MKKYLALIKNGIMDRLTFRANLIVTFFGNIIYLVIVYFLWRAIYASSGKNTVNGMTFNDTMIYLVLATALFNVMEIFLIWQMGNQVRSGKIVLDLLKPTKYGLYMFFGQMGEVIVNFILLFLPTAVIIYLVTDGGIPLGRETVLFFFSAILAFVINYCVNMLVAALCLFTESSWGINIMKEVIVSILSGASIPLAFFPENIRKVVEVLPFQAIYNTPLTILINTNLNRNDYVRMFGIQTLWLVILLFGAVSCWKFSLKYITINGG